MKLVTILFLRREGQLLLAMKKRGFGAGNWNGVGGKVEPGETITEGAIRECREEIGVTPLDPKLVGTIQFFDPNDMAFYHNCHIYVADSWEGEPVESEEMRPQWYDTDAIPYDDMWPDDPLWLPLLIAGKHFEATIWVDENRVTKHDIVEVSNAKERPDGITRTE
jgi:8-oxo-dGTP pyrophosphatase MutT (NUDIX family)